MTAPNAQRHAAAIIAAARAVARPGEPVLLLVDRDGRKARAGWESLDKLEQLAHADPQRLTTLSFAVKVAEHVLAIDCDNDEATRAAHQIAQWCTDAGAEPVLVRSGRTGHVHLWCVTNNPALHRACVRHAARAGADVRTGRYMRPPGAAHTTGAEVHVEGGLTAAVEALTPDPLDGATITAADTDTARTEGAAQRRDAPQGRRAGDGAHTSSPPAVNDIAQHTAGRLAAATLTAATVELLRHGDHGGDRSATLQRILVGMVNRGWSIDAAWDALMVRRHRGAAKLHERFDRHGPDAAWSYLTHSWDNAVAWVAQHPPRGCDDHTAALIDAFAAEADTHHWPGEAGASAWMVLHTLCVIGRRGPGIVVGASERDLAERAALSRATVRSALKLLVDGGWITRLEVGRGPRASVWRLETSDEAREQRDAARRSAPLTHPPTVEPPRGCVESGLTMRAGSDAFRRGALGANGYRVLRALLLHGAATTTELAARLGLHRGSVARVLNRCASAGLAARAEDGTWELTTHPDERDAPADGGGEAGAGHGHPPVNVDPDTGEITGPSPDPAPAAAPSGRPGFDEGADQAAGRPRGAPLVFDPSKLSAVAVRCGTVGARVRARALHHSEREEYARSAAYAAASTRLRRVA